MIENKKLKKIILDYLDKNWDTINVELNRKTKTITFDINLDKAYGYEIKFKKEI